MIRKSPWRVLRGLKAHLNIKLHSHVINSAWVKAGYKIKLEFVLEETETRKTTKLRRGGKFV